MRPGKATVIFHPPIEPSGFTDRDELMLAVRQAIASALPPDRRDSTITTRLVQVRQLPKHTESLVDFLSRQRLQALRAELLH